MQNKIHKLDLAELPAFPGPSKNGGKIFKANPNIVNAHQTRVVRSNTIGLIFFLFLFIISLGLTFAAKSSGSDNFYYISAILLFCSSIMSVIQLFTIPNTLHSYSEKISKIFLEVSPLGIKGLTIDYDGNFLIFEAEYGNVQKVIYNPRRLSILLKDGTAYNYDVFCNTHEIYSLINQMSNSISPL